MSDVTRILSQIDAGDPAAAEQLLALVYEELRRLARQKLTHEKPGQALQPTALVHERQPTGPSRSNRGALAAGGEHEQASHEQQAGNDGAEQ
jgi:hypothetical protein